MQKRFSVALLFIANTGNELDIILVNEVLDAADEFHALGLSTNNYLSQYSGYALNSHNIIEIENEKPETGLQLSDGVRWIDSERRKQIGYGFDAAHDCEYNSPDGLKLAIIGLLNRNPGDFPGDWRDDKITHLLGSHTEIETYAIIGALAAGKIDAEIHKNRIAPKLA